MDKNLKDRDVLLVKEKDRDELKVVSGMDKNGKLKTVSPTPENQPDFMKIDRLGNVLENFFENFMRQAKNPTHFMFFKAPESRVEEVAASLQKALKSPNTVANKELLDMHRVKPEYFIKKQVQASEKTYAIDPDLVRWDKFEQFGISRDSLEKTGNLDKLLDYRKTDLLQTTIKVGEDTTVRTDARFSLRKADDGSFSPSAHFLRKEPELERPYFGVRFTDEDKKNLLTTGNLGRVVEAEFKQG